MPPVCHSLLSRPAAGAHTCCLFVHLSCSVAREAAEVAARVARATGGGALAKEVSVCVGVLGGF